MEAGRELDALVAEKIMGWTKEQNCNAVGMLISDPVFQWRWTSPIGYKTCFNIPGYSTNIAAAWQVVEKMWTDGWKFSAALYQTGPYAKFEIFRQEEHRYGTSGTRCKEMPLAICKAALKAMESS